MLHSTLIPTEMKTTSSDILYSCNDMNFTGLSIESMECLCINRIPLRTTFPTLVIDICHSEEFGLFCKTKGFEKMENRAIDMIIDTIQQHINSSDSRIKKMSLNDPLLWKALQSSFRISDDELRQNHEKRVEEKVNTNMKSNVYYQYCNDDRLVYSTKRTRKHNHDTNNKIRYARTICLS